ncbi:hypothetical protein HK100_002984 [Physocladia obscura]|uniref:Uncharacterized protein n=1 Tax=Physocladia obscura TaxID=109957 RepID=A0AAD5SUP9_9FUNG|nr:hypothetical protein HK100_002984 [Physocladia obscura]
MRYNQTQVKDLLELGATSGYLQQLLHGNADMNLNTATPESVAPMQFVRRFCILCAGNLYLFDTSSPSDLVIDAMPLNPQSKFFFLVLIETTFFATPNKTSKNGWMEILISEIARIGDSERRESDPVITGVPRLSAGSSVTSSVPSLVQSGSAAHRETFPAGSAYRASEAIGIPRGGAFAGLDSDSDGEDGRKSGSRSHSHSQKNHGHLTEAMKSAGKNDGEIGVPKRPKSAKVQVASAFVQF